MTGSTSTPAGRTAFTSFLSQERTCTSSETDTARIITQICVVEHVGHVHLKVHYRRADGTRPSSGQWRQISGVTLSDVEHVLVDQTISLHVHSDDDKKPKPADPSFFAALPSVTLSEAAASMLAEYESVCSICLVEYEAGDEVVCMPCGGLHKYHAACLSTWLENGSTCPCCKWAVPEGLSMSQRTETMKAANEECERLAAARLPPCLLADDSDGDDEPDSKEAPRASPQQTTDAEATSDTGREVGRSSEVAAEQAAQLAASEAHRARQRRPTGATALRSTMSTWFDTAPWSMRARRRAAAQ